MRTIAPALMPGETPASQQLELFDLTSHALPRPRRQTVGWLQVRVRYDQAMLVGMATIVGLTMVFASGVERGKQLARSERLLLAQQESVLGGRPTPSPGQSPTAEPAEPVTSTLIKKELDPKRPSAPVSVPKVQGPRTRATGKPRYAVQVVTYSRPQLAKRELDRLLARGERAFLMMREGRTAVYVGPFPSKVNAKEKVALLKMHYQDCFVKTL